MAGKKKSGAPVTVTRACAVIGSPAGPLTLLVEDGALIGVDFGVTAAPFGSSPVLDRAEAELNEYFAGERRVFTLPLRLTGTPFQIAVTEALLTIPYGETVSYGELARRAGNPRAARAVGQAIHRNPLPIVYPCHRVIGADGSLTGFGGGLGIKRILLETEQRGLCR